MRQWRASIRWLLPDEGGRATPFTGQQYSTVVRLPEDPLPWDAKQAWSMTIHFDETDRTIPPVAGEISFLSSHAPIDRVRKGALIELYEGRRRTAIAEVQ